MKYALIEFKIQKKLFKSSKSLESLKLFGSEQAARDYLEMFEDVCEAAKGTCYSGMIDEEAGIEWVIEPAPEFGEDEEDEPGCEADDEHEDEPGTRYIYDDEGEAVDKYVTSGCRYNDFGMCQGCPTCRLHRC